MNETPHRPDMGQQPVRPEATVFVMPVEPRSLRGEAELDLAAIRAAVWRARWFVISVVTVFAFASIALALVLQERYRAEVLLRPVQASSGGALSGQLGGLASLAGIRIGSSDDTVESVAILTSKDFIGDFIADLGLMPAILSDGLFRIGREPKPDEDIRDAIRVFSESVLEVAEDKRTGLVTLRIKWTDRKIAADWANEYVKRLNDRTRSAAEAEAQRNIEYLQAQLGSTEVVVLQQSLGRILETEMQKLMLARGNEEYSFKVLDPAVPPKQRASPRRTIIVILGTFAGLLTSLIVVPLRARRLDS